jgi:hypothetical protein
MRGYEDAYDEYAEFDEQGSDSLSRNRGKRQIFGISFLIAALVSTTVAANITISKGRIEFGQGLYRIKACDQWVGIGLYPSAAVYGGLSKIKTVELVGLDPRLCKNVVFRIKFYKNSDLNTPLPLFYGVTGTDTVTASATLGNVTQLSLYDSATVSYPSPVSSYNSYASKALTLMNMAGVNIGYGDAYHSITYYAAKGTYRITFLEPNNDQSDLKCFYPDVDKITIESANLPS